jgi:DNA (cytosine-5)-methyltransferase 1
MDVFTEGPLDGQDDLGQPLPESSPQPPLSEAPPRHPLFPDDWPSASSLAAQDVNGVNPAPLAASPWETPRASAPLSDLEVNGEQAIESDNADNADIATPVSFDIKRSKNIYVELPQSTLVNPRSQYDGWTPPLPPSREWTAVAALMEVAEAKEDFVEFELDQFVFYINSKYYAYEMRPLQHMATRVGHTRFFFNGVLSVGDQRHYVENVEVSELPIGNYGVSNHAVDGQIWVRSVHNADKEVYYRLKRPATEYRRFYEPFVWIADFAKHVVDFSAGLIEQGRAVDLHSFKESFAQWLHQAHGEALSFQNWRQQHPSRDYRTSITANIDFIWKEMNGVLGERKTSSLHLFRETYHFSRYKATVAPPIPMIVEEGEAEPQAPTIVTPYIKECFGHMSLGKMLRVVDYSTSKAQPDFGSHRSLDATRTVERATPIEAMVSSCTTGRRRKPYFLPCEVIDRIRVGDTISTPRDGETTDTKWRSMESKGAADDGRWFGLVQKVHVANDGFRTFDVTWFYRPVETPCCMMKYPWPNELFLSDHCTCEEGEHARVKEYEVLGVHHIDWFGNPNEGDGEFFVRQSYLVDGRRWVTLQKSHMTCSHGREKPRFRTGDAVLAALSSDALAEPYEVAKIFKQGNIMFVRLRRLLRRSRVDPQANPAPNELVYSDQFVVAKANKVGERCVVRIFRAGEQIPVPYDRGGTGNLFYITHRLVEGGNSKRCIPFDGDIPSSFRQGFNPANPSFRKLKGMDLFCGSGNFGRGLEEAGAIEMHWANDIWDKAIYTYMANSPGPKTTKPFLGSIDDLLRLAIEGKYADNVPRPGEVDFISAGSPCPGFSLLTQNRQTLKQFKNRSLVASFASFVDFYRPKYGVLENVATIVQARKHNQAEDVLSQLICAIVGMGYQAQLIMGDAWSHGAPQARTRVFLYFAAPGLRLPEAPGLSHSHFPAASSRDLGVLCNGEPYVRRSFEATPFKYVSASEGTADLQRIGDGKPDACIRFPDHRVCTGITRELRRQIQIIPIHPYGMDFVTSWRGGKGVMSAADRDAFPAEGGSRKASVASNSKAWQRIRPTEVFRTVTTGGHPGDARGVTSLHWNEDRPLTLQEVRRAQGFPDHEVFLGNMQDKWKLVGNSVARQMALALGLKLREAWVGTLYEDGRISRAASRSVTPGIEPDSRARSVTTPASAISDTRAGMRKRLLSQTLTTDLQSPKMPKLERDSTPASEQQLNGTVTPASGLESDTTPDDVQESEAVSPVQPGPTVVRLSMDDELEDFE